MNQIKNLRKKDQDNTIKNDKVIFEKITKDNRIITAIENCKYMEELNKGGQASDRSTMTKVYKIVNGLKEYLE